MASLGWTARRPSRCLKPAIVGDRLRAGLCRANSGFAQRWGHCSAESFKRSSRCPRQDQTDTRESRWRVDLAAKTVTWLGGTDDGDDDTAWDIVWLRRLVAGGARRTCKPRRSHAPLRTSVLRYRPGRTCGRGPPHRHARGPACPHAVMASHPAACRPLDCLGRPLKPPRTQMTARFLSPADARAAPARGSQEVRTAQPGQQWPVVVLAYAYSGAGRIQRLLSGSDLLACTSGTGLLPLCAQPLPPGSGLRTATSRCPRWRDRPCARWPAA